MTAKTVVGVSALLIAHPAAAQQVAVQPVTPAPTAVVEVDGAGCGNSEPARNFVAALDVELGARPIEGQHLAVLSECDIAGGHLELSMAGRKTKIDVSDVPQLARPRTAAVAVAETLRWWSDVGDSLKHDPSEVVPNDSVGTHVPIYPAPLVEIPVPPEQYEQAPSGSHVENAQAEHAKRALDLSLGARGLMLGPEQTLLWGPDLRLGWQPFGVARAEIGVGYLRASDTSVLGDSRLHALSYRLALEVAFAQAANWPSALQAHLGLGVEGMNVTTVADSAFGYDDPGADAWVMLLDVHATMVALLDDHWRLLLSGSVYKDAVGAHLQAGGRGGYTLYGLGAGLRLGVGREF